LPRDLSEAICQQCHCQGVQAINVSGKNDWDFRPGLRLTDYRVDFQFRRGDDSMRLVGHVEQMHASKCYIESETLTCVTCHDPHAPPDHSNSLAYFREKCYQCHQDEDCGQTHEKRLSENQNDCSKCHMPRGDTNVSHFALHDHRIGIHRDQPDRSTAGASSFEPILDITHLPASEQKRLGGLAKYEIHRRHGANPKFADFNIQATGELIQLYQAGKADADVNAALAWLARDQGELQIAEDVAREIRQGEKLETMPRVVATSVLAGMLFARQDFKEAVALYRELDGFHRDGRDSYFRGLCEQNTGNTDKAIEALKQSVEIEPSQVAAHAALVAIYGSLGKIAEAQKHREAVERNQILQQAYARGRQKMIEQAGEKNAP
jgi:tetratricopeptide (TPR) repeat protein